MKIGKKISLSFLITATILTTVVMSIIYIVVKSDLKKVIFHHLTTAVESRGKHIETFLNDQVEVVELMSSDTIFIELLSTTKGIPEYNRKIDKANRRIKGLLDTRLCLGR